MCRHSIVAHLMDISTGERYIYAALMLCALMVTHSIAILVVWYDINCKFAGWFKRWSQGYQAVLEALRRFPGSPSFPLPCFHRFSHRWVQFRVLYLCSSLRFAPFARTAWPQPHC
jgi:hypothetical protein